MFVNGVRLPHASGACQRPHALPTISWSRKGTRPSACLLCSSCHSSGGYLGVARSFVAHPAAIEAMLARLAEPEGAWSDRLSLASWRGRRMPPFTGTGHERRALAAFLAVPGGADRAGIAARATAVSAGAVCLLATLMAMGVLRDHVRAYWLGAPGFQPAPWVASQWGAIVLFLVLLVTALGLVGWMVTVLLRAPAVAASPAVERV